MKQKESLPQRMVNSLFNTMELIAFMHTVQFVSLTWSVIAGS